MKSLLNVVWCFLAMTASHGADIVPDLFTKNQFNAATLAQAANHYIDLGEAGAIIALKALDERREANIDRELEPTDERIGWICRIIFQGKEGKPLRQPGFGRLSLPHLTMPLERWPLYPVVESDGVFFVMSRGYWIFGRPEQASAYIDYCSTEGEFRKTKVGVPTHDEAVNAFNTLKGSDRWKMIEWIAQGPGPKYKIKEDLVLRQIEEQATSIPKR
jgi:hypothetical protein